MEQTLVLIKPDAVERGLIGEILAVYERAGLQVVRLVMHQASRELASRHYAAHIGRPYYDGLCVYITRGPLVAAVLAGTGAIGQVRDLNGATDPAKAAAGTIRARFGISLSENCVHASDSPETASQEIQIWFGEALSGPQGSRQGGNDDLGDHQ